MPYFICNISKNIKLYLSYIDYYIHIYYNNINLKLNLKNGKSIYYSSNDNFCNSEIFINFCKAVKKKLIKFDGGVIVNKKSFMQTKIAYHLLIFMTVLIFGIFILKI